MQKFLISTFVVLICIVSICDTNARATSKRNRNKNANEMGSRALGFNKRKTTPKPVYKWRPSVDSKQELAKQMGLPEPDPNDPEFEFLWPDDYYDDYDFEHQRNMIQHGTWEAKTLNYHAEQLREAKAASKAG